MAFQLPFKLSTSCLSAKDAIIKKDGGDGNKKKGKEDELFIPNATKMDNHFRVACSVAALLLFFHDRDFRINIIRGDTFLDSDASLSEIWLNILLKKPAAKLSITLMTILTHQEARCRPWAAPPF
jgi:hypothetical protein